MLFLVLILLIIITFIFFIIFASLLWTSVYGKIPYLPTPKERVDQVISFAHIKKGDKTVDLGSGDGRIVIAMAQQGAEAHGYELNLFYVLLSKWKIRKLGLQKNAFIHWRNYFNMDLSSFDVISFYAISYVIKKLEEKIKKETKKTSRIIAISYKLKTMKPAKHKDFVFLYKNS